MTKHMIITYSADKAMEGHVDPNFTELVYGDIKSNGKSIKENIQPGSYNFFNTRIGNHRYITACFYVEKLLLAGEHDHEIAGLNAAGKVDDVIVIGSRVFSKVLTIPLKFDKELIVQLPSLKAGYDYFEQKAANGVGELEAIKDKTLTPRIIEEDEKEFLMKLCARRG